MSERDRDQLADWLLSTRGRVARIVGGTILILLGLGVIGGFIGVLFLLIGAVPIATAAYGALLVGPLLGRDTMGRRPEDQPEDEEDDESDDDESESEEDDDSDDSSASDEEEAPDTDPEWEAPPVARAERPEGQSARTRDLRAEEPAGSDEKS